MLSRISKRRAAGFSLAEMMVGIAILGILISIALPSFQTMLLNSQTRNAAESVVSGLLKARAQAVMLNTNVTFSLGAATTWTVNQASDGKVLDFRSSNEGSKEVTVTAVAADASATKTITFNNYGLVVTPNADNSQPLSQLDFQVSGGSQNLRVLIGAGGSPRMCDPGASGGTPTAC